MHIVFQREFKKKLYKLPQKTQDQFYERLTIFLQNKQDRILNNHSVEKVYPGYRSINITGDYRAIFKVQDGTLVFKTIGTHSELY